MKGKVLLLGSEGLGRGDDELGRKVMVNFLAKLLDKNALPATIFMVNSAVKLAVEGTDAHDKLVKLEEAGVPILACMTCVKHHNLVDRIAPHRVSSMDTLIDLISSHEVVSL